MNINNLTEDEVALVRHAVAACAANYQQSAISILRNLEIATNIPAKGSERDWLESVDPNGGFLSEEDQTLVDAANAFASGFDVSEDTKKLVAIAVAKGLVEPIASIN